MGEPGQVEQVGYPCLLGVECDRDDCEAEMEADFLVRDDDGKATRLGYILDHATKLGWQVLGRNRPETALTYCPIHKVDGHD